MNKLAIPGRYFLCTVLTAVLFLGAQAQVYRPAPVPAISFPASAGVDVIRYPFADTIEAKLVKLALEGPMFRGSENQNKINELQLRAAKNNWMNLLTLSINYNDQSFAHTSGPTNATYVYPKYFFGFNIPLGTLLSRTQVKAAREQVAMSKEAQQQLARVIREDVVAKYRQYKTKNELLKLQIQVADDEQAGFLQIQKNYRSGSVPIDIYNTAQKKYNTEQSARLNMQLDRDVIQLDLEKMIGVSLESVIK